MCNITDIINYNIDDNYNNIIIINKKLCESYSTIDFKVEFDDDTEKNIKNDIMEYIENNESYEIRKRHHL